MLFGKGRHIVVVRINIGVVKCNEGKVRVKGERNSSREQVLHYCYC
jgi:hypothetical protein